MKPTHCYFTQERSFDPPILHVTGCETVGKLNLSFCNESGFRAILAMQPTCNRVMFYFSHMPQRAVPVEKIDGKMMKRFFKPFQTQSECVGV